MKVMTEECCVTMADSMNARLVKLRQLRGHTLATDDVRLGVVISHRDATLHQEQYFVNELLRWQEFFLYMVGAESGSREIGARECIP